MELIFQEVDGDVMVLTIDGGIDSSNSEQLRTEIEKLIDGGVTKIILDGHKITHISSLAIGVLLRLHRAMQSRGGEVKLAGLHGMFWDVLRLMKLDRAFEVYDDVGRARLAFRPKD